MDKTRWLQMTIYEQFGNIAGEISRARHWQECQDINNRDRSLERVIELVDMMLEPGQESSRIRELARFREIVSQWLIDGQDFDVLPEDIENYCLPFAIQARKEA